VAGEIDGPHAALRDETLDLVLAVDDAPDDGLGRVLQDLAVAWAEGQGVLETVVAHGAELHAGAESITRKLRPGLWETREFPAAPPGANSVEQRK
jgi:hypothetical protein